MHGSTSALDDWRLVRRYAVPAWMIAECAEARERGDWRAACAAARVTVAFDDPAPAAHLLAGFAPDLLRWHLPRATAGTAALAAGMRYVLAPDGRVTPDTVVLGVRTPRWVSSSQRLTLHAVRVGDIAEGPVCPLPPYLWDARRAGELRGVARRSVTRHPAHGVEAWALAGWSIDEVGDWSRAELDLLSGVDPRLAARELRRVAAQFGRPSWVLRADHRRHPARVPTRYLRLATAGDHHQVVRRASAPIPSGPLRADLSLHPALLRAPVDLALVWHGRIGVEELHPLVRDALFPAGARPAPDLSVVPAGFAEGERIRVRCGSQWHWIGLRGGRLDLPHHTDAERRREHALRAFGGTIGGCFAAESAWRGGDGVLPRRLRDYRRDLWRRMEHGGSRVVLALLDAGMDPGIRDGLGRTLLHRMHQFEAAELLPRLLAEGLDVNAVDRRGNPPVCEVMAHSAPTALITALNEAGAIPRLALLDPRSWPEPVEAGNAEAGQLRGWPASG